MKPTTYRMRDDMQGVFFAVFAAVAVVALLSLIVSIWSLGQSGAPAWTGMGIGLTGFAFCAVTTAICLRLIARAPKFVVCVDGEGIWHETWGRKDGLVPWEALRGVRRRRGQRLELLDEQGRVLLRLHPQLRAFGELTETIAERATRIRVLDKSGKPSADDCPLRPPSVYNCRPIRYYGFMGGMGLLLAVSVRRLPDLIGLWDGATAGLLIILFWRGRFVRRIEITPEHLDLQLLRRQTRLAPEDIASTQMEDVSLTGVHAPAFGWLDYTGLDATGVTITTRDEAERYALYDMGVHPEDLARRLNAWLAAGRGEARNDEDTKAAAVTA